MGQPDAPAYRLDHCDECGGQLAPEDQLWGLCSACMGAVLVRPTAERKGLA